MEFLSSCIQIGGTFKTTLSRIAEIVPDWKTAFINADWEAGPEREGFRVPAWFKESLMNTSSRWCLLDPAGPEDRTDVSPQQTPEKKNAV